jgi:hypothetical protein
VAEKVDDHVHLLYYKYNGGLNIWIPIVQINPMLYLKIPTEPQGIAENENLPKGYALSQNYPNPFNTQTTISFNLKQESIVNLSVYDIKGSRVVTLADGILSAGSHEVILDAKDISSGVYYYKLSIGDKAAIRKMILLK